MKSNKNLIQKVSLLVGSFYSSLIFLFILLSSSSSSVASKDAPDIKEKNAGVEINNFNRSTFENGEIKLKIIASTTTYNTTTGEARLVKPNIFVYDKDNSNNPPTEINASSAKIISKSEGKVESALLEGDVIILLKDKTTLRTSTAEYSSLKNVVHCPDPSNITGMGYEISGDKMDIDLSTDSCIINGTVKSTFKSINKIPTFNINKKD